MSFTFDRLEDRKLLAASVSQKGGNLTINGTNSADDITIETWDTGSVTVTDNTSGDSWDFEDVVNITVNGKKGDDTITVFDLDLDGGKLTLKGDDGHDEVFFDGEINAEVSINAGGGNDLINFGGSAIYDDVQVKAGAGDDDVHLDGTYFAGDVGVDTEKGDDYVQYDEVEIEGYLHVKLGRGDDTSVGSGSIFWGNVHIEGQAGDDVVDHDALFGGNFYDSNLEIDLNGGRDFYREVEAVVEGNFNADGGPGNDDIDLEDNEFNGGFKVQKF